ncbi:hypothetical protein E2I00_018119 [Balaenoptera physalus]|uniref:Guanylate cyclase domain-containing protein n=1 Tax=Balaenoptera physalus TaxID=9770 RepID=A0A643CDC7_BALPH|nr:hypothetical protein E2I00_018119 [Balaenoptera physalus]
MGPVRETLSQSWDWNPLEANEDCENENEYLAGAFILDSTGVSMEAILKLFGEYFFKSCKMSGDDRILRTLGGNLTEFTENLDALQSYLALSYQEMNAPSFCVERGADGKMLLHYYSGRSGLCHIVPGIIEAVAKDSFDIDVTVDILDVNQEERTGKKEHVVFLIVQKSHRQMRRAKPKGSQDTQDSQRDQELRVKQAGVNIQKYVPGLQTQMIRLDEYFSIVHPQVTFNLFSICKFINREFKTCTIVFSDVVTFTNICAACEPIQIVNMLNLMYSKFDRLTSVHDVYKIRVGIPTAPVLAGVMGDKMPRYCLFGDTVNTVCRMESHGLPNKVHLSPTAYRALDNQGFEIIERGEIEVKGKGKMTTYFLIRNLNASEDEIMGRPQTRLDPEGKKDKICDSPGSGNGKRRPSPRAFLAEASAQGRRDSRTLAVMRSADSRRLLPKSETARGFPSGTTGLSGLPPKARLLGLDTSETSLSPNVRTPVKALLTDQPHQAVTCLRSLRLLPRGTHFPLTGLQRRASLSPGELWLLKALPGPGQSAGLQGRGATHRALSEGS